METKEYIVILHNYTDLDDFYTDMEQHSHYEYVPNRPVDLAYRRPASRSTHYMLTDEEATALQQDPRVLSIHRPYYDLGLKITPFVTQSSNSWDKSSSNSSNHMNWGLLRGYLGSAVAGWGSNDTPSTTGTINLPNTGRNVDVVIADGHMNPNHPEFAVNPNGIGESRVHGTFNWFQYDPQVRGTEPGNYVYDFGSSAEAIADNNHGCHVAGIVAGNTCGWARGANIYNISPYSTTINSVGHVNSIDQNIYVYEIVDYIRQFHKNKEINPDTGRRNPTIVNMSWGFSGDYSLAEPDGSPNFDVDRIVYGHPARGGRDLRRPVTGWNNDDLDRAGLVFRPIRDNAGRITDYRNGTVVNICAANTSIDGDIRDAIAEGIIFVGAAGNNSSYADLPGTDMYRYNTIGSSIGDFAGFPAFFGLLYMYGAAPTSAPGVICVGAVDSVAAERKVFFSTSGPRVDVYAPGTNIMSSVNTQEENASTDPRNSNFFKIKKSGTSMASPQVAGIIACALETYPNMTQTQALSYIQNYANNGALLDAPFDTRWESNLYKNFNILHNSPNRYATYQPNTRPNQVQPIIGDRSRPTTGAVYPRTRTRSTC